MLGVVDSPELPDASTTLPKALLQAEGHSRSQRPTIGMNVEMRVVILQSTNRAPQWKTAGLLIAR
jgi:hypothetical protein